MVEKLRGVVVSTPFSPGSDYSSVGNFEYGEFSFRNVE